MAKAVLFSPPEDAVNSSVGARAYLRRLSGRLDLERRDYRAADEDLVIGSDVQSVAVLSGLSGLVLGSGYMEVELDTVFRPQELLRKVRAGLRPDFPIVAIMDDAYSDYIFATFVRAGATAVVGTSGELFGAVLSRMRDWDQITPYINVFERL
jgi:hypothetical protein